MVATLGADGAADVLAGEERRADAETATRAKQEQAGELSAGASRRGVGHELDADNRCNRSTRQQKKRYHRKHAAALQRKEGARSTLLRRSVRDQQRAEEQCAVAAEDALKESGMRWHFRALPKLAWFTGYFMGLSLDRSVALRALNMLGVPKARFSGVMFAAFKPQGYTPSRDVFKGKRRNQTRFVHDGRQLDGKQWRGGYRDEDHPGALRVLQVFAFLWLAKSRTDHRGYTYNVRGFGRGLYAAVCRCGIKAITGHSRGVPGALLALKQAGVIWYRQPTEDPNDPDRTPLAAMDKGPTGHAYNCIWFPNDPEEQALEELFERVRDLASIPVLERMLADPSLAEAMAPRPRGKPPPPVVINEADIPY